MSHVIKIIDSRIARFSTGSKDTPIHSRKSFSDYRHVKLNPIGKSLQGVNNINSLSIQPDYKEQTKLDDIDLKEAQSVCQSIHPSPSISDAFDTSPKIKKRSIKRIQIKESTQPAEKTIENLPEKPIEPVSVKYPDFWREIRAKITKNLQIPIIKTPAYTFIIWKHTLKRGINQLSIVRKIKIIAALTIQKNWRRFLKQNEYNLLKSSTSIIKDYWLHVRPERLNFKKIQFLSRFLYRYTKISYRKKTKSAIIIQKWYKRFIVMKKYRPAIQEKLRAKKHRDMMRKQQTLVQERNRKKQAARRIEQGWLDYMNKKRMRDIRKYLWSLPYECRLLYLKFKQVKQDADMLKADVEQMIANKQGSIASNVAATE